MDEMTEFRLTYDGPALANHEMDPRELAPALMAMADLLEASARVLYGDDARIKVSVKGSFKTGSFNIDFVTSFQWLQSVRDMFAGQSATATANALAILSAVGVIGRGAISLLKWLKNRTPDRTELIEPGSDGKPRVRIFVGDDFYDVEKGALDLLRDVDVRRALDRTLAPLAKPGIDTFALGRGTSVNVIIEDDEREYFLAPGSPEDRLLIDDVRTMAFSIVSLAFKEDNKWRLSDGSSTISATISDEQFLHGVNTNAASFAKGDALVCTVRVRQWQTVNGTRTEYDVVRVNDHLHAARQIELPWLS
ncbi:hypothetical protein [Luteibacter yeojuensis]|uniref:Uncharacterized protein n=1 Tax=Luteibacter yeojuensis TaxID=345309 RepID=A0A0F3KXY2_9GAMM|nr:hypothetical protein [Luteibacter yeojuensis]KJV36105.1 hypothetical protein VI08_06420 [Luteibacter yeojuensis]